MSNPSDVATLVHGLKFAKRICEEMKASGYPAEPHGKFFPWKAGKEAETTDADLEDYVRTWGSSCCKFATHLFPIAVFFLSAHPLYDRC